MNSDEPKKRKISHHFDKTPAKVEVSQVLEVPPVEGIMSKSVAALGNEINRLYVRSSQYPLSDKEARILQGHIKTVIELSKHQMEREKAQDLSDMSDDDLFALAKQIISKREQD